jgi:hypothetical protein
VGGEAGDQVVVPVFQHNRQRQSALFMAPNLSLLCRAALRQAESSTKTKRIRMVCLEQDLGGGTNPNTSKIRTQHNKILFNILKII